MFKSFLLFILSFLTFEFSSQVRDDFSGGDLNSHSQWVGTTSDFIINSNNQLQLNASQPGKSYLSTNHQLSSLTEVEWNVWIKMTFSPSANNYSRFYLTSSNSDLTIQPEGFYLQLGETGSDDAVHLMRRYQGQDSLICSGTIGQIASSFAVSIKVIRTQNGSWKLYVDPTGLENFTSFSLGYDTTQLIGSSSGFLANYTISNSTKFYYDNFYVGPIQKDTIPPKVVSYSFLNAQQLDLLMDEVIDSTSLTDNATFILKNETINTVIKQLDNSNNKLIHLVFDQSLMNGKDYNLEIKGIKDIDGNQMKDTLIPLSFLMEEQAQFGDVIITELMIDPSPSVGLPEVEYIELFNRSNRYLNLQDWKITDGTSIGKIPNYWLKPKSYALLISSINTDDYPDAIAVTSFPSLNNDQDRLILTDDNNNRIESLNYSLDWYHNDKHNTGGYALERIDTTLKCNRSENWKASNSVSGGTPGIENSVNGTFVDNSPAFVKQTIVSDTLIVIFNEPINANSIISENIAISPTVSFSTYYLSDFYTDTLYFFLNSSLSLNQEYELNISAVNDCLENQGEIRTTFVLAELPDSSDILINEIMFHPSENGSDYIELYNTTSKNLELKGLTFANYDDGIGNEQKLNQRYTLRAFDYVTICEDTNFLNDQFTVVNGKKIQLKLPNYNNDSSTVYITYGNTVFDKLSYKEDWHLPLLENFENKALERISITEATQLKANWRTAASNENYGTPSRVNSQKWQTEVQGKFELLTTTITPNNDGNNDYLSINYELPQPAMIGSFYIFDVNGRLVHEVFKSQIMASNGNLVWDGYGLDGQLVESGIYVAYLEVFDTEGINHEVYKKTFVLYQN